MRLSRRLVALAALVAGCSGTDDTTGPDTDPPGPPVIESFLVTSTPVRHGEWTQLRWRVSGATAASVSPDVGALDNVANGAESIRPHEPVRYTLTASNTFGTVEASIDVDVEYLAGIYVDSVEGDDANSGASPQEAIATLALALERSRGGNFIFLSAGDYEVDIVIDGPAISIRGALDPVTFFADPSVWVSTVRPAGADVPLTIRDSAGGFSAFTDVVFDARNGGEVAVDVESSLARFESCTFAGSPASSGTAVRIRGTSDVRILASRVFGGRDDFPLPGFAETRGIAVLDASSLLLNTSFVDGGRAGSRSSGVDVATTGSVRMGFNTIGAHILAPGGGADGAAALRIRQGAPSLGGNILFTRGTGKRNGVLEDGPDADPSWMMGNLFISAGTPPYENDDGVDANTEKQLNDPNHTNGAGGTVWQNRLVTGVPVADIFRDLERGDFHLVPSLPPPSLAPNPAVDSGIDFTVLNPELFGATLEDIDRERRPSVSWQYDQGADEL